MAFPLKFGNHFEIFFYYIDYCFKKSKNLQVQKKKIRFSLESGFKK